MNITVLTPLYPPDIADPAPYVKELVQRLVGVTSVTVVTYGALPETVPGITIVAISKRSPAWVRIPRFALAAIHAAWNADILYIHTGLSAELPAAIVAALSRTKVLLRIDSADAVRKSHAWIASPVRRFLLWRAHTVVRNDESLNRPEILPLEPRPEAALARYEQAWAKHIAAILTI